MKFVLALTIHYTPCHSGARPKRSEGREPGIHIPALVVMDSGSLHPKSALADLGT
jgi:hypothetical protein